MPHVVVQLNVEDYEDFAAQWPKLGGTMKQHGADGVTVYRHNHYADAVIMTFDWADAQTLETFLEGEALRDAFRQAHAGEPQIMFVDSYSQS
ncbi:MAG: hypothetical protein D6712_06860 [Chloroflexi bacterium]|nr:MAG: hypothetical protein D6712_06860 [Chloroflexota bacterium]